MSACGCTLNVVRLALTIGVTVNCNLPDNMYITVVSIGERTRFAVIGYVY